MVAGPKISAVLACHNRRLTTLNCLRRLHIAARNQCRLKVFLLDDASTDGTAQDVQKRYPDVTILSGSGQLFWGGGMHLAMTQALREDFDFLLMLNDDVDLHTHGISLVLRDCGTVASHQKSNAQIIVGSTTAPDSDIVTYSGFRRLHPRRPVKLARLDAMTCTPTACDTMNGNFVLIPRDVALLLGPVDKVFRHFLGDLDYGYRAVKAGARLWVSSGPVGACAASLRKKPFEAAGLSLAQRLGRINTPLGLPILPWTVFMWRHGGVFGLLELATIYFRVVFRIAKNRRGNQQNFNARASP